MSHLDFDFNVPYEAEHLDFGMTSAGTWHLVKESPSGALAPICGSGGKVIQRVDGIKELVLDASEPLCFKCEWTDKMVDLKPSITTRCSVCDYDFGEHPSWYDRAKHRHLLIREIS